MITQAQAEIIREQLRANVRRTTGHDAARAIANCCIDALGGVEPLVVDGWKIKDGRAVDEAEAASVTYYPDAIGVRIDRGRANAFRLTHAALDALKASWSRG